jgi:hypothetical protein
VAPAIARASLFVRTHASLLGGLMSLGGHATLVVGNDKSASPLRPPGVLHGEGSAAVECLGEPREDRRQPPSVHALCSLLGR